MTPTIWAHRGASSTAPENTMDAFRQAVEVGADGIELDVQRTADERLVVIHDETVDRTTTGTGRVADLAWDDIRDLDASAGQAGFHSRIPLLDEVLELLAPTSMVLNVELKDSVEHYEGMDEQVARAARAAGMADRIWFSSFNHVQLAVTCRKGLGIPSGILYGEPLWQVADYATRMGAQAVHPDVRLLDEAEVATMREVGLRIHAWTANDPVVLRRLAGLGVDAVITDDPELAQQVLRG